AQRRVAIIRDAELVHVVVVGDPDHAARHGRGAAQVLALLEHGHRGAGVARVQRRRQPCASRPDDDDVELVGHVPGPRSHGCAPPLAELAMGAATRSVRNRAPVAPSTARWSHVKVIVITRFSVTSPSARTTRDCVAPTARIATCGTLTIASNSTIAYIPR